MTVPRDVVRDLLPLYVAGEASADTRAIVEACLQTDPELAALAAALREDAPLGPRPPLPHLAADRQALERTRRLLRQRTGFFAAALLFTTLPFTFVFGDSGLRFLLVRDVPGLAVSFFTSALVFWIGYAVIRHKMRVSGL